MIISLIAAISENRVLGYRNGIPWDAPDDRRHFREITMGHTLIMGRRTFESIGKPLEGRRTIILSRREGYTKTGCVVCGDLKSALELCRDEPEVLICGGEEVYRQSLPLADRIYLTVIHQVVEGDTFFPDIGSGFVVVEKEKVESSDPPLSFMLLIREGGRMMVYESP